MTIEELNTKLYKKMFAEQEQYRDWLLSQPSEEILNHCYEYTVREDILMSLEYHDLPDAQARALLKSPSPLADVFTDWEHKESGYMEDIWQTVEDRAKTELTKQQKKEQADSKEDALSLAETILENTDLLAFSDEDVSSMEMSCEEQCGGVCEICSQACEYCGGCSKSDGQLPDISGAEHCPMCGSVIFGGVSD